MSIRDRVAPFIFLIVGASGLTLLVRRGLSGKRRAQAHAPSPSFGTAGPTTEATGSLRETSGASTVGLETPTPRPFIETLDIGPSVPLRTGGIAERGGDVMTNADAGHETDTNLPGDEPEGSESRPGQGLQDQSVESAHVLTETEGGTPGITRETIARARKANPEQAQGLPSEPPDLQGRPPSDIPTRNDPI